MSVSITTSVRLPQRLSRELARRAKATKRGKNWVVKEALELYLLGSAHDQLREEARRQSLCARRTPVDAAWAERGEQVDDWKS
jgi:predicted DNA-binding protein